MSLPDIQQKLRKFAEERNWEQFHSPKNLSKPRADNPETPSYGKILTNRR
ncbi:MAG: hypothetical protein AB1306_04315 [Nitrospirota bacterium]